MPKPTSPNAPHAPQSTRRTVTVGDDSQRAASQNEFKRQIRDALQLVVDRLGRVPTETEIDALCRYNIETIRRYFGDLESALAGMKNPKAAEHNPATALQQVVTGQVSSDKRLRSPPNVAGRPSFREDVLALAKTRGVEPMTTLEEAMVFQWLGVGPDYFRHYPLSFDKLLNGYFPESSAVTLRLAKIKYLLLGQRSSSARGVLAYHLDVGRGVIALELFDHQELIPQQWHALSADASQLVKTAQVLVGDRGVELLIAWSRVKQIAVMADVKEALIRFAIGAERKGRTEFPIEALHIQMGRTDADPIAGLVQMAALFDERLQQADLIRISYRAHGPRKTFAQLRVEPWGVEPLPATAANIGQMVFRRGERWQLMAYKGVVTEALSARLLPKRPVDAPVSDDDIQLLRHHGQIRLTWVQLRNVMATPHQRHLLMQALWKRDHASTPFPQRYAFKTLHDEKGGKAESLEVVALDPGQFPSWSRDHAALIFDTDARGPGQLKQITGKNSQELAEDVLQGNGIQFSDPLERHVALRQLAIPGRHFTISPVLSAQEVLSYMSRYGIAAPLRLASKAHQVNPEFPKEPKTMAFSGMESQERVVSIKLWSNDANRKSVQEIYFWVQWERDHNGQLQPTLVSRRFGHKIVGAIANGTLGGGRTIAPDAEAGEQTAAAVAKYTQAPEGFTPLDEKMSAPEPLTTPAELKKTAPLENVPVTVENDAPGFAPTPLTWKDIATPPTDTIPAQPVDLPEFIGSDTFLPEPPLEMVVVSYVALGGAVAATGALMVLLPEVELISLSLPKLAPIPATLF